jgi:hypothetical protein
MQNKKIDSIPRMRFQETSSSLKDDTLEGSDEDMDIKLSDENKSFLFDNAAQDKELKRRGGLDNGMVKYNDKRTVNIETSDFVDLYYTLFE